MVEIDYTNYKGVRRWRKIIPIKIIFDSTAYHPEPQWLLSAHCLEDTFVKFFAMKDIHGWRTV